MAARNESKATGALASLENEGVGPGSVVWLRLDLKDLKGVKRAAEEFLSKETRLDILGAWQWLTSSIKTDRPAVNNAATYVQTCFDRYED